MADYFLIHDDGLSDDTRAQLQTLFEAQQHHLSWHLHQAGAPLSLPTSDTPWVLMLSDEHLVEVIPRAVELQATIGLLPHPQMTHARVGYGISPDLEQAVEDILSGEATCLDMLYCNDRPVFNAVIIGNSFVFRSRSAMQDSSWQKVRRFFGLARNLMSSVMQPFTLTTAKGQELQTAALGVVVVEHARNTALSRSILEETAANDGTLHALVLAPRSILEGWKLLFGSIFLHRQRKVLPETVGHIRTGSLKITTPKPVSFEVDSQVSAAAEISFRAEHQVLSIIPGRDLQIDSNLAEARESFRTTGLPQGESRTELMNTPLPWVHHASTEEFKDLFLQLKDNAWTSESYLVLMVLSTLLATVGLFANSASVIIGAMILAPLMSPIVSMAMGLLRQQEMLIRDSGQALVVGIGLALACGALLTLMLPLTAVTSEIAARLSPTLLDLGVAVISGIAGAYAHARAEVARSLAGVAIAVALVPPLAVAGIGIGWGDWLVFWGAFLLFLTNLTGIILSAAMTFMALGYSPFVLAKRGLALSAMLVTLVSIPLTLGFMHMVERAAGRCHAGGSEHVGHAGA